MMPSTIPKATPEPPATEATAIEISSSGVSKSTTPILPDAIHRLGGYERRVILFQGVSPKDELKAA